MIFNDLFDFQIDRLIGIMYNIIMSEKVVICIILYHGTIDKYADDIKANGINLKKSKHCLDLAPDSTQQKTTNLPRIRRNLE